MKHEKSELFHEIRSVGPDLTIFGVINHSPSESTLREAIKGGLRVEFINVGLMPGLRQGLIDEGHDQLPVCVADAVTWQGHDQQALGQLVKQVVESRLLSSVPPSKHGWMFVCPVANCSAEFIGEFHSAASTSLRNHVRARHSSSLDSLPAAKLVML